MAKIEARIQDARRLRFATKTITFDGTAGKGAIGNAIWFTVTGSVLIEIIVGFVPAAGLAGATATITLGVEGRTNQFIAATTATLLAAGSIWVDATPDTSAIAIPTALQYTAIIAASAGANDIASQVAVAAVTGGVLRIDIYWRPLSSDGNVVPA